MSTFILTLSSFLPTLIPFLTSETTSDFRILLEHAISASDSSDPIYKHRTSLRAEVTPLVDGKAANVVTWRLRADSSNKGEISREDVPLLELGGLYRVRAKMDGTSDGMFVFGWTKVCLLIAADFKHDIFMSLDSNGTLHSIDIRPSVPSNFSGCRGSASSGSRLTHQSFKVNSAGSVELTGSRFGIATIEEVMALPVVNAGKGIPHFGQSELTKEEAARITSKISTMKKSSTHAAGEEPGRPSTLDAEEALAEAENASAQKPPEEPTFMQKWMPYILGAYIVFSLSKQFLADPAPK